MAGVAALEWYPFRGGIGGWAKYIAGWFWVFGFGERVVYGFVSIFGMEVVQDGKAGCGL